MKNVFITGLALGIECDACKCMNANFEWLLNSPSNLLWIDKIHISRTIYSSIIDESMGGEIGDGKSDEFRKALKLIFQILDSIGMIEIIDVTDVLNNDSSDLIYEIISSDLDLLRDNGVKVVPNPTHFYNINGVNYCYPKLWTTYAALLLSQYYGSHSMLSQDELYYLDVLVNVTEDKDIQKSSKKESIFREVFNILLPQQSLCHPYLIDSKTRCETCVNSNKCQGSYLVDIESNLFTILSQRNHDEISQLRNVLDSICDSKFEKNLTIDPQTVLHELNIEKIKVQKSIEKLFPKITHWSNLITTLSIPFAIGSSIIGSTTLAGIGAAGFGFSKGVNALIENAKSKKKWVNFLNTDSTKYFKNTENKKVL